MGMEHILKAQRGSPVTTLGPRYVLYNYMGPLGRMLGAAFQWEFRRVHGPRCLTPVSEQAWGPYRQTI